MRGGVGVGGCYQDLENIEGFSFEKIFVSRWASVWPENKSGGLEVAETPRSDHHL